MRSMKLSLGVLAFFTLACGGTSSDEDGASGGDPDEVICCEYKGAKGTATRKKCKKSDGKVLDRKECP